jgi:hypothetical protein
MLAAVHVQLLKQALSEQVSARALQAMIAANLGQDSLRYQMGHDEFHFDNNAIPQGRAYIEAQRAMIQPALLREDAGSARAAFGRLTHAAQDFYAHTNYVSLWLSHRGSASPDSEIPPLDPGILSSPNLHSGKLYLPQELLYFIPPFRKFSLSILPADSHAHMNLDSSAQGPLFDYAFRTAVERTRLEFEQVRELLSPGQFALFIDKRS